MSAIAKLFDFKYLKGTNGPHSLNCGCLPMFCLHICVITEQRHKAISSFISCLYYQCYFLFEVSTDVTRAPWPKTTCGGEQPVQERVQLTSPSHCSSLREFREGTQGRNLEVGADVEAMEECCPLAFFSFGLSYSSLVSWALPHQ